MGLFDGTYFGTAGNDTFQAYKRGLIVKFWGSWEIFGNGGNDRLTGGPKDDTVWGGVGDDVLYGEDGNDYMKGGPGSDRIYGGNGFDRLLGESGNDLMYGGAGNDYLDGGLGNDLMVGGDGADTYIVDSINDQIFEYWDGGDVDRVESSVNYTLGNYVENLTLTGRAYRGTGNFGNNYIVGNNYGNELYGLGGNDTIGGGSGNDLVSGGDGKDSLFGNGGNDVLQGGAGDDGLYGGDGDDALFAGSGKDLVNGGAGNDVLFGFEGNDTLIGGAGSDRLRGYGYGNEIEQDTLTGGESGPLAGADTFILGDASRALYTGPGFATITDFSRTEGDKLELYGSLSDYSLGTGNFGGGLTVDRTIFYRGDLIGVLLDVTTVVPSADFVFV